MSQWLKALMFSSASISGLLWAPIRIGVGFVNLLSGDHLQTLTTEPSLSTFPELLGDLLHSLTLTTTPLPLSDKVLLCSQGWPGALFVAHVGPQFMVLLGPSPTPVFHACNSMFGLSTSCDLYEMITNLDVKEHQAWPPQVCQSPYA